jgi:hypothetical protein
MDMFGQTLFNVNLSSSLVSSSDANSVARDILYKIIKDELTNAGVENAKQIAAKIVLSYAKRTS